MIALAALPARRDDEYSYPVLYAACDDGTLWVSVHDGYGQWYEIEGPPRA